MKFVHNLISKNCTSDSDGAQGIIGYCSRKDYWRSILKLTLLSAVLFVPQYLFLDEISLIPLTIDGILALFIICYAIWLSIKRLNDAGISGTITGTIFPTVIVVGWICKYLDMMLPFYIISCIAYALIAGLCCLKSRRNGTTETSPQA